MGSTPSSRRIRAGSLGCSRGAQLLPAAVLASAHPFFAGAPPLAPPAGDGALAEAVFLPSLLSSSWVTLSTATRVTSAELLSLAARGEAAGRTRGESGFRLQSTVADSRPLRASRALEMTSCAPENAPDAVVDATFDSLDNCDSDRPGCCGESGGEGGGENAKDLCAATSR